MDDSKMMEYEKIYSHLLKDISGLNSEREAFLHCEFDAGVGEDYIEV